jgi:predicted dehydrogenase
MKYDHSCTRRSFLKTLGTAALAAPFVTRGLMAQSPNTVLRHASFGTAGQAWYDLKEITKYQEVKLVAVAEVDLNRTAEFKKKFPDVKIYQDWRKLLEQEGKNLDSVNVSTPDHMHAPMAMSAMELGKHVYCEKPLAHDLHEVRRLNEFARKNGLVTQMGIQIHATNHYKMAAQLVQSGVIGKVKEVHSWCPKSWGDPGVFPNRTDPVPEGFDWDLWLGVCAQRPFIGKNYYHPAEWRKRLDFGTGTFGDMGCHIFDPVFNSIGLTAPISVRSEGAMPNQWNWALDSLIHYVFPGTEHTEGKTLNVTWYDGAQNPPAEIRALLEGDELPNIGSILVGTEGVLVIPHVNRPLLYPDKKFKDFKYPAIASADHYGEFVDACRGKGKTLADFSYAGPLTETVLLGGVASRFQKTTLQWNRAALKFDLKEANHYVRRDYRKGWQVKDLA